MRPQGVIALVLLVGLTVFLLVSLAPNRLRPGFYFLDVGQGDSELTVLANSTRILIDAGPDARVTSQLEYLLPQHDRYIDIGVISHPELDHFGGYLDLLDRYTFGIIIVNGRMSTSASNPLDPWASFLRKAEAAHIPILAVGAGDQIQAGDSSLVVLSPDNILRQGGEMNDTALVVRVTSQGVRALFTGDISSAAEQYLTGRVDLRADVLKVAHHGSAGSSDTTFLGAVGPKVAVIEVGKGNHYGHPTVAALERLTATGAHIYRTDEVGLLAITTDGQTLFARSLLKR